MKEEEKKEEVQEAGALMLSLASVAAAIYILYVVFS